MKKCPDCKLLKSAREFWKNSSRKDGLQDYCKCCGSIMCEEYRKTDKAKEVKKRFYLSDKSKRYVNNYRKTERFRKYWREYCRNRTRKLAEVGRVLLIILWMIW